MLGQLGAFKDKTAVRDPGHVAFNVLRVASDIVSAETVTIGSDVYEVEIVNTDSTDVTAKGDFNNTTAGLVVLGAVVTYPNITFIIGLSITIDTEILEVTDVTGNDVTFDRGVFGTTSATHADGTAIFITVIIDTDSTDITAKGDFNNTDDALVVLGAVVTYANVDFTPELFIKIEDEIMEVTSVDGNDVTLSRGAKSTAIVAHPDATSIFETSLSDVDTTDDTTGGDFNNTTDALTVIDAVINYANITFAIGQYLKIGTEILEVTNIVSNDVTFARGVLATTTATHVDALDIFETTISYVDSTDDTAPGRFNNTEDALVVLGAVVTYPNISFSNSVLIKIESEILEVTNVTANDVTFDRASSGTSVAVHADGLSIFVTTVEDTDSTDITAKGRFNNTTDALIVLGAVVTYANVTFTVGLLIRVENEIIEVTAVNGNDVTFKRGVSNTAAAAHADALSIYEGDGIVTGIAVGLVATLTPTVFTDALIDDINNRGSESVLAIDISANEVLVHVADSIGGVTRATAITIATSEGMGGANNQWDKDNIDGGLAPHGHNIMIEIRVPTAQEVALGTMHFIMDFNPGTVFVETTVTATGKPLAWAGEYTILGRVITLDNTGGVDWAATDTVSILAIEG